MNVYPVVIAMTGLAVLRCAEVADTAVGTIMIVLMVVMMRMRRVTVIVRMDDGLREDACRSRKAQAEGRSHGKHQRQCPQ